MWRPEIQGEILQALKHERLDHFQISATVAEPAFRVLAELRVLKGQRLVYERISPIEHVWGLTGRGEIVAWSNDQLELGR